MRRTADKLQIASTALVVGGAVAAAAGATTTLVRPPWSHCYGLHRVTQTHLTVRAGFGHRFENPQGLSACKLAAEDDTTTTRDDDELTVIGVNSDRHQLIYNTSLISIAFYGREGDGVGELRHPLGVASRRDGHVVVADTGNDRLHVLRYADDRLQHVRFIAGSFAGARLERPTGVALEGNAVYVCDSQNDRILVLDLEGNLVRQLAPERDGQPLLQRPFAVAAIHRETPWNFFGEDFVVVTDSAASRLLQLRRDGSVVRIVRRDAVAAATHFDWLAVDFHASVYVSDRGGRLHKFDRQLDYLLSIAEPGAGEYPFDEPRGMGLYRRFGQLFVAERQGAQYLWTGTDVFSPSLVDLRPETDTLWSGRLRFFLTEYARVQLDLVDARDAVRVALQPPRWTPPGAVDERVRFDVPAGQDELWLRVRAQPVYSSRTYLATEKRGPQLQFDPTTAGGSRP